MLEVVTCVMRMSLTLTLIRRVLMTVFHCSLYLMVDVVVAVVAVVGVVVVVAVVDNWLAVCCCNRYGSQPFVVNLAGWNLGYCECCLVGFSSQ